jgi:hypothetical protein
MNGQERIYRWSDRRGLLRHNAKNMPRLFSTRGDS